MYFDGRQILLALDRAKVKGLGKKQALGLGKNYIYLKWSSYLKRSGYITVCIFEQ